MTRALTPATVTRLEKVAVANGFDQELPRPTQGEPVWLGFASTHAPLRIWLSTFGDAVFIAAFSQLHVARALGEHGTPMAAPLPPGAVAGRTVVDIPSLHRLVRRAFQLSRALPDELLHAFERQTAALPRTTEAERLVVQRVGQDLFRAGLIGYWEGRCALTGLDVVELCRRCRAPCRSCAPATTWADCATDAERLDVYNGLLLAPHLDAAFDRGFITVADDGTIVVSARLDSGQRAILGLAAPLRLTTLASAHRGYLEWHRARVFDS